MSRLLEDLDQVTRYDRLFVSPHLDDVVFSCPASLLEGREAGLRTLVISLFTRGDSAETVRRTREEELAATRGGFDALIGPFEDAPFRGEEHRSFLGIVWGRGSRDQEIVGEVEAWMCEVRDRASPREVVAPLAVGRHIDHRLTFSAARRLEAEGGAATFSYYEDRPYAFVNLAVEMRLAELGLRTAPELERFEESFLEAPYVRTFLKGAEARERCLENFRTSVEGAEAPLRAPRSRVVGRDSAAPCWDMISCYASQLDEFIPGEEAFTAAATDASERLGLSDAYAERLWRLPL